MKAQSRSRARLLFAAACTTAIVVSAVGPAPAAGRRDAERVEKASYDAPGGIGGVIGVSVTGTSIGAVMFPAGPERKVSVSITDASGLPVSAEVKQRGGDGVDLASEDTSVRFCGETEKPVRVQRNTPVYVFIYAGPCQDGTPAAATTGEVTATFIGK